MPASKDLTVWAQSFTADVDKLWSDVIPTSPAFFEKYGYAVFYSPVRFQPKVMLIGANPGAGSTWKYFDRTAALRLPNEHAYFGTERYDIAKNLFSLLQPHELETLKSSVKLNLNFFRSNDIPHLQASVDPAVLKRIEKFCSNKIREAVAVIQPRIILAEGVTIYDRVREILEITTPDSQCHKDKNGKRETRYFVVSHHEKPRLIGILHPSSAMQKGVFNRQRINIGQLLTEELKK